MYYYKEFWQRSFDFSGLSDMTEYFVPWIFHIGVLLITLIGLVAFGLLDIYLLIIGIYFAFAAIPMLSSTIRRLHDNNVSRYNILWIFIPFLGQVLLLTMLIYREYSTMSKKDFKGNNGKSKSTNNSSKKIRAAQIKSINNSNSRR